MTPRLGRVREIIEVGLARPRSLATLQEPLFHELANHIRSTVFTRSLAA
jgi:NitT/TauT family transport system ATP-binding protein